METLKELLVPSNACLLLAAIGALVCLSPAHRRLGRRLLAVAAVALLALSSGWTATALLAPLEYATTPASLRNDDPPVRAIVVLGAYGAEESEWPLSSRANGSAMSRCVETLHLIPRCAACDIHVTGNAETVTVMAKLLVSLGAPSQRIALDPHAEHTLESARNLAEQLRGASFYLVTSAAHMPRALIAFRAQGLAPLPAPTDYQRPPSLTRAKPWPSPLALHQSDLAVHEYLGILWYRLQGL